MYLSATEVALSTWGFITNVEFCLFAFFVQVTVLNYSAVYTGCAVHWW